jgi:bifunctional DNA-binding transcriptional regulator/antitoxin component of YhaV-PrlF toxin-antitoxin module
MPIYKSIVQDGNMIAIPPEIVESMGIAAGDAVEITQGSDNEFIFILFPNLINKSTDKEEQK